MNKFVYKEIYWLKGNGNENEKIRLLGKCNELECVGTVWCRGCIWCTYKRNR